MRSAQSNGTLLVFAAGNGGDDGRQTTQPDLEIGAMPYRISELADEWLLVVSVDETEKKLTIHNVVASLGHFAWQRSEEVTLRLAKAFMPHDPPKWLQQ